MVPLQWQYINMTENISQYTVLKLMYLWLCPIVYSTYHNQQTNVRTQYVYMLRNCLQAQYSSKQVSAN